MHREHSQVKPSPAGGRQLAIYKDGSAVELRQLRKTNATVVVPEVFEP